MDTDKCCVCGKEMPMDMEGGFHEKLGRFHVGCAAELKQPKPRLKLSPELADGSSWTPVDTLGQMLDAVTIWHQEGGRDEGEHFSVEVVMMSDLEIAELPEL